jgi:hypothetical protein
LQIQIGEVAMSFLREECKMTKTVNLPELIYEDLVSISDGLAQLARKPFSPAMTISLLIEVYRAYLSEPCARDAFRQNRETKATLITTKKGKIARVTSPKIGGKV